MPKRIFPVFRDREELASSSSLGENIQNALRQSRALIVICSPRAAASRWVNEEVKLYKSMDREDRVFCLIVDGEPYAAPDSGLLECFPKAVLHRLNAQGELSDEPAEPIAADAREGKDGKRNALLKLIAGIVGVPYDELRQRERQRQIQRRIRQAGSFAGTLFAMLLVYLGGGGRRGECSLGRQDQNTAGSPGAFRVSARPFRSKRAENRRTVTRPAFGSISRKTEGWLDFGRASECKLFV